MSWVVTQVFIRVFLEETMPNPKPYPGHAEFFRDVLPCFAPRTSATALPAEHETAATDTSGGGGSGGGSEGYGFTLVCNGPDPKEYRGEREGKERQRFVQVIIANAILGAIGGGCASLGGNYMIGQLHYLQEDTVAVTFAGRVFLILGAGISAVLLPRLGPWKMYMIGSVLIALGPFCFVTFGKYGPYVERLASCFGYAVVAAPQIMYIGAVFQQQDLTRVQIAFGVVGLVPGVLASQLWPMLFFGGDKHTCLRFLLKISNLPRLVTLTQTATIPGKSENMCARFRSYCAGTKVRASACRSTHPGRQWSGHVFTCLRVCVQWAPTHPETF